MPKRSDTRSRRQAPGNSAITTAAAGRPPAPAASGHLADSKPFLGTPGTVEEVPEMKIETLCAAADLRAVIAAMREAHPYETPAFQFWPVGISEKEL